MKIAITLAIILAGIAAYGAFTAGKEVYIAALYGAHCYRQGEPMPGMKHRIEFDSKAKCEAFLKAKQSGN